jgi:hypothetical protein
LDQEKREQSDREERMLAATQAAARAAEATSAPTQAAARAAKGAMIAAWAAAIPRPFQAAAARRG